MDLKESDILGKNIGSHWYYHSKAKAVLKILKGISPKKVLDIGSGSAFFAQYILDNSHAHEAWCVDISYPLDFDENIRGKILHFRKSIGEAAAIDLVLLMDVLEHVDEDVNLLKKYVAMVPSGSKFLLTVPAFQCLWSSHDEFLEHKRRYTLKQIEVIAKMAGLKVNLGCYFFGLIFPIAALIRIFDKYFRAKYKQPKSGMKSYHPFINSILKMLCKLELSFMTHNRFIGLTALCFAEKP